MARTFSPAKASALHDVEVCCKRVAAARAEYEHAVAAAVEAGCSLRDIADHTDSSHMAVKRLIARLREGGRVLGYVSADD